eukprot:SAG22_NODE_62_length_23371_cov_84.500602_12_plen_339_part_00
MAAQPQEGRSPEAEAALLGLSVDGFCVLPHIIPDDGWQLQAVRDSVVRTVRGRAAEGFANPAGNSTFINVNQDVAPWFAAPRVLAVVEACFGPVPHTRIGCTSCVIHEPEPDAAKRAALGKTAKGGLHSDWPGRLYKSPMWSSDRGPGGPLAGLLAPNGGASIMTDLQAFFVLTDFTEANGATMVRPGSHRHAEAPNGEGADSPLMAPHPSELQIEAPGGSCILFDGRLWHKTSTNRTASPRVFVGVKYVPWWLNLHCRRPDSVEMRIQAAAMPEAGSTFGGWPFVRAAVFDRLPEAVQPLFQHWVDREWGVDDSADDPGEKDRLQPKSYYGGGKSKL